MISLQIDTPKYNEVNQYVPLLEKTQHTFIDRVIVLHSYFQYQYWTTIKFIQCIYKTMIRIRDYIQSYYKHVFSCKISQNHTSFKTTYIFATDKATKQRQHE